MSDSSGSGISYHHGDDLDDEGSVAASHASDMPDTPNSKKRARPNKFKAKPGYIMESSPLTRLCCTPHQKMMMMMAHFRA
jgi:hypothetical protein